MGQKRGLVAMSSTFFEKGRKFFSKLGAETHGPAPVNKVQRPMGRPRTCNRGDSRPAATASFQTHRDVL